MFIDYYALLSILPTASKEEIKKTVKEQAKKWHPDINKSPLAHERILLILEAYHILGDIDKRSCYDKTYSEFVTKQTEANNKYSQFESTGTTEEKKQKTYSYQGFDIKEELLMSFVQQAKRNAKENVEIVVDELRGSISHAASTASGCLYIFGGSYLKWHLIAGAIIFILSAIGKSCS
jgi:DnaJ-class molecular chaperone